MNHRVVTLAWALKRTLRNGYNRKKFLCDLRGGITVGIVAIPLAMALGVASGVAPQNGLYTAIIAGVVIAVLGGSKFQVSGPTAAFVVLLVPVVQKFGLSGLLVAGFIAGILLVILGLMRLAEVIQYIPHPVTTGFTSGIAVVIAVIQLKDFFGLTFDSTPNHFHERVFAIVQSFPDLKIPEAAVGFTTVFLMIFSMKRIKSFPAPVVAISAITFFVYLVHQLMPGIHINTIGSVFTYFHNGDVLNGVPNGLPSFQWPWAFSTPTFPAYDLTFAHIVEIFPYSVSIAMLGAIESLLSAVVADGATQKRHNPNGELLAQGIGNIVGPFFGAIPATGAIARTMTNIRFGGVSPISAVIHSLVVLIALLILAPLINLIPMAGLAAVLLYVAYNMGEPKHFLRILKTAPSDDRVVLMTCFIFTVFTDMTIGVGVGLGLASLLFIRRMSILTGGDLIAAEEMIPELNIKLPKDTFLYRIHGSMFFGAAHKAVDAIQNISSPNLKKIIIDMTDVPMMDSTGLVALESTLRHFCHNGQKITLVCPAPRVRQAVMGMEVYQQYNSYFTIASKLSQAID